MSEWHITDGSDVKAHCSPCRSDFEIVRQGVQVSTVKQLIQWLENHKICRTRGDVIIRVEGNES